jgi:hypothetical protein
MKQMKTTCALVTAVLTMALAGAAGLHAQNTSTSNSEQPSSITVTGCLQPAGVDRAVGTSGSTSAADTAKGPFMLVSARVGHAPGGTSGVTSVAPPGSGTTDSAARAGATPPSAAISGSVDKNGEPTTPAAMFALKSDNPELSRHVGQEVELSGRVIAREAAASNGTAEAASGMQELDVQTIRMVASVCAAAK